MISSALSDPRVIPVTSILASHRIGGAARVAMEISGRLAHGNRQVAVLVPGIGPARDEFIRLQVPVQCYRHDLLFAPGPLHAARGNLSLGIALQAWRRKVLHFHSPAVYRAGRLAVGRCLAVVHVHIEESAESLRWSFQKPPQLIVPCARFMEPAIRAALPPKYRDTQRIEPMPNAVDVDRFAPLHRADRTLAKRAVDAPSDRPLIVMIANLAPHKGQATAIRAVARLKALGVAVECWLAGEDRDQRGYDRELAALADAEGVADRVKLLGFRSEVERLYAAADMLLLPSTHEGLPLTILEAQAAGVPVLAAPTAGVPEVIVDGQTGWLIAHDDVEGYAQRIKAVVENPGLHQAVADRAFDYVRRHHNWDDYCDRMIELYDSLE